MDNSRGTQLAIEFIDNFLQKVEEYNELQTDRTCRLTDGQIQQLVQQSVADTDKLAAVKSQDMVRVAQGLSPMTYSLYIQLLRHEATLLDERKIRNSTARTSNVHS